MAERKVPGNDVFMFIDPAGGTAYELIVCLTSNSFGIQNAIIDAKSKCGADTLPGTQSFSVSFEGQVIYEPGASRQGIYDLLTLAKNQTTVGWKISTATPVTGDVVIAGTGFLGSVETVYGDEAPSTFTAELGVYGTPTITETA